MKEVQIEYLDIEKNKEIEKLIEKVVKKCFEVENLEDKNLYIEITLTNPENIRKINSQFRGIDKETDVLSFPMFEKDEIEKISGEVDDALGDIVISIPRVEEQANEYEHSFERELSYMVVHGFYHLMGYDHETEADKKVMREHEEKVLGMLSILQ